MYECMYVSSPAVEVTPPTAEATSTPVVEADKDQAQEPEK
jgi:hypothetical protein